MEINVFLSMLLYIAAIVLIIIFIIVGIKLIGILDKTDKVIDDLSEKVHSFDNAVNVLSKTADGFANISNSFMFGVSNALSKIFKKKIKEED